MNSGLISIVGAIATGKTTLADRLARDLGGRFVREDYAGNPFLCHCRSDDSCALPSQIYFLISRTCQLFQKAWPEEEITISDYGFCQDDLYARLMLFGDERRLYLELAEKIKPLVRQPDIIIRLDAPVKILKERIEKRGRTFESMIDMETIERLRQLHMQIEVPEGCKLLDIQSDDLNDNPKKYDRLMNELGQL